MLCPVDKQFHKAVKSGNRAAVDEAFKKVYESYSKLVAFIAAKYIFDRETIKEIVNDVFVKAFEKADKIHGSLKYFLAVSARNAAIDRARIEKRRKDVFPLETACDKAVDEHAFSDVYKRLERVVGKEDSEIILLHVAEGYSFKEIAAMTKRNANTVITKYRRAIEKFRKEGEDEKE